MRQLLLLLPGEPGFAELLATPPPDPSQTQSFVVRAGQHVAEAVEAAELNAYLEGGSMTSGWRRLRQKTRPLELIRD